VLFDSKQGEDVLFDSKQGNDDDRLWLVCHYQAMGGPKQSMCNFGYSWSGLSSPWVIVN